MTISLKTAELSYKNIYDSHFEGVEDVEEFIKRWESFEELLPKSVFTSVLERFHRQLNNAKEWRDVINTYFYRKTGIPDEKGRKIYE